MGVLEFVTRFLENVSFMRPAYGAKKVRHIIIAYIYIRTDQNYETITNEPLVFYRMVFAGAPLVFWGL
jgi:hypothetical protein